MRQIDEETVTRYVVQVFDGGPPSYLYEKPHHDEGGWGPRIVCREDIMEATFCKTENFAWGLYREYTGGEDGRQDPQAQLIPIRITTKMVVMPPAPK